MLKVSLVLTHDEHEGLEFQNEKDWRHAWRENKATFGSDEIGRVEGITGFRREGRYVLGAYDKGFFILDMVENRVETFRERAVWRDAANTTTNVAIGHVRDPKSWLVQSRNLAVLATPAALFLPWCLWPVIGRRRRRVDRGRSIKT